MALGRNVRVKGAPKVYTSFDVWDFGDCCGTDFVIGLLVIIIVAQY